MWWRRSRRRRGAARCCCRRRLRRAAWPKAKTPRREPRRGVWTSERCRLLPLQGANVVHELPALVFREVLPGRHRAAAVRQLPEDLTVGLLLDRFGSPVRRLRRRQRRGGRAVALAPGAVTRDAVRLDRLLGVADTFHWILQRLRFGRRNPGPLGRDHRGADRDEDSDRGDGDAQRLLERAHEVSSRTIVTMFTKRNPFNTRPTNEAKQLFDEVASRRASRARPRHRRRPRGAPACLTAAPTARRARRSRAANGWR